MLHGGLQKLDAHFGTLPSGLYRVVTKAYYLESYSYGLIVIRYSFIDYRMD